jgi:hypothetical protein
MSYGVIPYATDLVTLQALLEGEETAARDWCRALATSPRVVRLHELVEDLAIAETVDDLLTDFVSLAFRYESVTPQATVYNYLFEAMCARLGRHLDNSAWYPSGDAVFALALPSSRTVFERLPQAEDFPLRFLIARTQIATVRDLNRDLTLAPPLAEQFHGWLRTAEQQGQDLALFYC